jgi:hypothetical protein
MKTYGLDTNCFIYAFDQTASPFCALQRILAATRRGEVSLGEVSLKVSLHTLHELEKKKDEAWKLAKTLPQLPHWPIGAWEDQVGTWKQLTGSWDDAKRNNRIQMKLKKLATSGTDIRDRGAYIDALCSGLDAFITSDTDLVGPGPARRINEQFRTKVITPEQLVDALGL